MVEILQTPGEREANSAEEEIIPPQAVWTRKAFVNPYVEAGDCSDSMVLSHSCVSSLTRDVQHASLCDSDLRAVETLRCGRRLTSKA
eukprot:2580243-Pleurochrysis_carterae.AAC.3